AGARGLAVRRLLRGRLAEVEPAGSRGGGTGAGGAGSNRLLEAARAEAAGLVLPGSTTERALPDAEAAEPAPRRRLSLRSAAAEGLVADRRRAGTGHRRGSPPHRTDGSVPPAWELPDHDQSDRDRLPREAVREEHRLQLLRTGSCRRCRTRRGQTPWGLSLPPAARPPAQVETGAIPTASASRAASRSARRGGRRRGRAG